MTKNINLLPGKKRNVQYNERFFVLCKKFSIIVLVFTSLSSIILFILNIDPSLSHVLQQKNNILTNLTFSHSKVAKYLVLKDRIETIDTILHNRTSFDETLATVQNKLPNEVIIDSFSLDTKVLTIHVSAQSLLSLDTFITNMTELVQSKKIFKTITISTITANQDVGKYTLSIMVTLL